MVFFHINPNINGANPSLCVCVCGFRLSLSLSSLPTHTDTPTGKRNLLWRFPFLNKSRARHGEYLELTLLNP